MHFSGGDITRISVGGRGLELGPNGGDNGRGARSSLKARDAGLAARMCRRPGRRVGLERRAGGSAASTTTRRTPRARACDLSASNQFSIEPGVPPFPAKACATAGQFANGLEHRAATFNARHQPTAGSEAWSTATGRGVLRCEKSGSRQYDPVTLRRSPTGDVPQSTATMRRSAIWTGGARLDEEFTHLVVDYRDGALRRPPGSEAGTGDFAQTESTENVEAGTARRSITVA